VTRKKEVLDLSEVIRSTVELLKVQGEPKGLQFQVDLPQALPLIEADRGEMEQLFTNLISNAIKYTRPGGRVEITLEEAYQARPGSWRRTDGARRSRVPLSRRP
jgi:signal transduction histidine kinase